MKNRILCAAVAVAVLAACNQSPQQTSSEPVPTASSSVTASMSPISAPAEVTDTVVFDGIHLTFPNKIRSSKDVTGADGTITHRIDVEYIGIDQQAFAAALKKDLASREYTLAGPSERDGVFRYLVMAGQARKGQVSVSPAGPALRIKLSAPGAKGVALFVWQETKPKN